MKRNLPRDWIILLFVCLGGFVLGRMQTSAKQKGGVDFVSGSIQQVVNPVASGLTAVANGTSDFFGGLFGARSLKERNRELEALAVASELYTSEVSRLNREIENLRKSIGLPDLPGKTKIPADVIGFLPAEYRITISAGKADGVRAGLPVICADGLVGVVQSVLDRTSQVTLIYSPNLKIGGVAQRNPPPAGLLRGESPEKLILEFVDIDAPAKVGDIVTTSGFSEKIPGGIPIGKIVQVDDDRSFGTRRAQIFPNVQIGSVREVFVLR